MFTSSVVPWFQFQYITCSDSGPGRMVTGFISLGFGVVDAGQELSLRGGQLPWQNIFGPERGRLAPHLHDNFVAPLAKRQLISSIATLNECRIQLLLLGVCAKHLQISRTKSLLRPRHSPTRTRAKQGRLRRPARSSQETPKKTW